MPRKRVVRMIDHPDMTSAVYCGHKARNQSNKSYIRCSRLKTSVRERELIFLLLITRNFMASVRRGSLSLLVLRVGCIIVSCSYNY